MKRTIVFAALSLLFVASPSAAKEGLYFGANILFSDPSGGLSNLDSGNGFALRGGIGIGRYLSLDASIFKTAHDLKDGSGTADLKGGMIDAKVSFPISGSHIEPYIFGGAGTYKLEYPSVTRDGRGGLLGVGIDIYLFPQLSMSVGLVQTNISFDATAGNPSMRGEVTTLDIGLTYHFI
jgi:hypothetical protein